LAQKFCPTSRLAVEGQTNVTCYDSLLEKANRLADAVKWRPLLFRSPLFVGSDDYWRALGIEPPEQSEITPGNIDELLNASKHFLRQISSPVERGDETDATHSEAYYLYRTLLMRQFSRLIFERKVDDLCAGKIKAFINDTLHATKIDMAANVDDVLADIYYHDIEKPTVDEVTADHRTIDAFASAKVKDVEYVANAMRIDLAYHPIVSPADRLEHCINDFMVAHQVELVLGNTSPDVLEHFNFDSNPTVLEDIQTFRANSRLLLNTLKESPRKEDTWNKSPVDLQYAYKDVLTRQTLFTLKALVQSLARCDLHTQATKIAQLRQAMIEMHTLLANDCFQLDVSLPAKQYLQRLSKKCAPDVSDVDLVNLAKDNELFFKLNEVVEGDIQVVIPPVAPSYAELQRNLQLSKTGVVQVAQDMLLINYTPGRDAQLPADVRPELLAKPTIHRRLAGFFSSIISIPVKQPARTVTQLEMHRDKISYRSYFAANTNIAKGTPGAWQRMIDSANATGSDVTEADIEAMIGLQHEARVQTTYLIDELRKCWGDQISAGLLAYIHETSEFLAKQDTNGSIQRYKFIEQTKAQLLAAISSSRIETVPGQIISFITETLGGNADQVFLAQHFCPNSIESENDALKFNPMLKKSVQLASVVIREHSQSAIFLGDASYWRSLHVFNIAEQTSDEIKGETVSELLNNTKILLRELGLPVKWGDTEECEHTEAYYLYRTLLMRQFAVLIHEKRIDDKSIQEIKEFITNTFHANPDVILDDVYFYGHGELPTQPAHVAGAMQLNLAYHPAISPAHLLDTCIEAYVAQNAPEPFVFGDPRDKTLWHLDPTLNRDFSKDITRFISDTSILLNKLSKPSLVKDSWNEASVNLYFAYKHLVTKQAIYPTFRSNLIIYCLRDK